jgi:hypothetical protein
MSKNKRPHAGTFKKGDPRASELGKKGGKVRADQRRKASGKAPYEGTVIDVMDAFDLTGPTWKPWRAYLKAVHALPMDAEELAIYRRHTERDAPPTDAVGESWMAVGRRGGKSRISSVVGVHRGVGFDTSHLAPGETAVVMVLAGDRDQAKVVFRYMKGLFALPEFAPFVHRTLRDRIELKNGVDIVVTTASFRTTRGFTVIAAILDEVAFWLSEGANPDSEIVNAIRPATTTVPGSLVLGLSSPYAAKGVLFTAHERYFGKDDPHTLVWNADTRSMNASVPVRDIERAFEEDPVAASAEYGQDGRVQFRHDVEQFLDPGAVRAVTVPDRRELPPMQGVKYVAFVDPSGGSQDSFTLAIAHLEKDVGVLDAVRERRPPFSPDAVVREFAALLKTYRITSVTGDRYGGTWPAERFRAHGIEYRPSERTKSDIYSEFVAPVNAGRVELLDVPSLRAQLIGLERRTGRGTGRDSIDHRQGGKDDVSNAAAGALVLLQPNSRYELVFSPYRPEGQPTPRAAPQAEGTESADWNNRPQHERDTWYKMGPDGRLRKLN